MVLTSDAKYGVRSYDNTLQLTLIRAGYDPDPDPEKGLHEFSLSLGVTEDVKPESLSLFTRLLNRPAASITARPHKGTLAGSGRFLTIQAEHVRLAAREARGGWKRNRRAPDQLRRSDAGRAYARRPAARGASVRHSRADAGRADDSERRGCSCRCARTG